MKKFIIKLFLVLIPVLLFVVLVNYFGDAAHLFSSDYENKIAQKIIFKNNVTNIYNYNERLLQKYIINSSSFCPEILVLGSSRVMQISSSYFKGETFFNNGVSGASIEDLLAVFQMYKKKKCIPKKIILGLDPWTLNSNNEQTRWLTLNREYYDLYNHLTYSNKNVKEDNINSRYYQLISPSYFNSSFKMFFLNSEPIITNNKVNNTITKLADGSITYDLNYRTASALDVERNALGYINSTDVYGVENFNELSPEIMSILEKFIKYLKNNDIEVNLFLAPLHPIVYSFISNSKKYNKVIESEKYFLDLGAKYDVEVVGSFNPFVLDMDNSFFYDGMHCNEKGLDKILLGNGR